MSLNPSIEREVNVKRVADSFHANETIRAFNTGVARIDGQIDDSLYNAGLSAGVSSGLLSDLIRIFSYALAFHREVQNVDRFVEIGHTTCRARVFQVGEISVC